jgi:uroporphyrinogen-III synthase
VKPVIYLTSPLPKAGTVSLPMIRFERTAEHLDLEGIDTLIFTSKQAVITAEEIDPAWKKIPAVAIGPATERQIRELGGVVLHRPREFYGKTLARDLAELFRDRRLLYLRPEQVSFDSAAFLRAAGVRVREQIIYRTSCRHYPPESAPPPGSVIVFTSPSTIHCFLENFSWRPDYRAVVIGRATREHLPQTCDYVIAREPSINACLERAREFAGSEEGFSRP